MSPELGEFLGVAKPGTKFRFKRSPKTTFTVEETFIRVGKNKGEEQIIGYGVQKSGPRILYPKEGWIGAGGEYEEDDVEIITD